MKLGQANIAEGVNIKNETGPAVKRVPAVRRANALLWELSDRAAPMNLSQASRAVGVLPSTCLHILRELVSARLVSYDSNSKTYQLGSGIHDLAQSALKVNHFSELAKPRLQKIANTFNMTATATSKADDQHLALTAFANPPSSISIRVSLGGRVPLFSGASGRIFAAYGDMSEKQIRFNFNQINWVEPIAFTKWMLQVQEAKSKGYAIDQEEFMVGVSAIAVPVYTPDNFVLNTIGVLAINSQLEKIKRIEIINLLKETAQDISLNLIREIN